jgi:hypothetical protein
MWMLLGALGSEYSARPVEVDPDRNRSVWFPGIEWDRLHQVPIGQVRRRCRPAWKADDQHVVAVPYRGADKLPLELAPVDGRNVRLIPIRVVAVQPLASNWVQQAPASIAAVVGHRG